MAQTDLVSLSDLKAWLSITTADAGRDAALSRLITQISRAVYNVINRPALNPRIVTEMYNGNGKNAIQLRSWPVLSISNVSIDGVNIPVSTSINSSGYFLETPDVEPAGNMQVLYLRGYEFSKGSMNVEITYFTGYMISGEISAIPTTPFQITPIAPFGAWSTSYEVRFVTGNVLMTQVASAPVTGQYSVSSTGVYTFAAVDVGKSVSISYGYIPADLSQIALEWAAYRWSAKDRIGQRSKSIGGQETVSYTNEAIPEFVKMSLSNYTRVVPC